ncbi:hypothetical protein BDV98DRAFT_126890 [Pterulicium gracile]|uniref:Uncharacterized protein n=1 Tax=Pterulicium gracile TaxID=1884261 RepID=A0A5C3QCZ0_9AGAR|nr:hypothetical protein BDV98DRAFT_126890 [Pterula gracilis]
MSRAGRESFNRIFGTTTNDPDVAESRAMADRLLPHIEYKTSHGSGHRVTDNRQALPEVAAYLACQFLQTDHCDLKMAMSSSCLGPKEMRAMIRTVEAAIGDLKEWERVNSSSSSQLKLSKRDTTGRITASVFLRHCQPPVYAQEWLVDELEKMEDRFWEEVQEEETELSEGAVSVGVLLFLWGNVLKVLKRGVGITSVVNKYQVALSEVNHVMETLSSMHLDVDALKDEFADVNSESSTSQSKKYTPSQEATSRPTSPSKSQSSPSRSENTRSSARTDPLPADPSTPSRRQAAPTPGRPTPQTAGGPNTQTPRRSPRKQGFTMADLMAPPKTPSKRPSPFSEDDASSTDMEVDATVMDVDEPGSPSKKQKLSTTTARPSSPTKPKPSSPTKPKPTPAEPQTPTRPKTHSITTTTPARSSSPLKRSTSPLKPPALDTSHSVDTSHSTRSKTQTQTQAQSTPKKAQAPFHRSRTSTKEQVSMPDMNKLLLQTPTTSPTCASRAQTRQQEDELATPIQRCAATRSRSPKKPSGVDSEVVKDKNSVKDKKKAVKDRKSAPTRKRRRVYVDYYQWTAKDKRVEKMDEEGDRIMKEMAALYGELRW